MSSKRGDEFVPNLRVLMFLLIGLLWISYFWELATGVTFVFSKSSRQIGHNSSRSHLTQTLEWAIGGSVGFGVILYLTRDASRR